MSSATLQPGPDHRKAVWDNTLDADMNVCYWTIKCSRSVRWDHWLKTIVALTASGTAIASLSIWAKHPLAWQCVAVIACVASVFHSQHFPPERLAKLSELVATWKEVSIDYELLWERYDEIDSATSWTEFESIKRRERAIDESQFSVDYKLREKAAAHVLRKRGLA
jgi:hypothetical protein